MSDNTTSPDDDRTVHDATKRRREVRTRYAEIATGSAACCDDTEPTSCCGDTELERADRSRLVGYSDGDRAAVEPGADLGLGCGNPTAIAAIENGDTVLDLGSGGGFDCFLAAREVGDDGRVIGVDMTPEMVERARENAETNDASNVEFRLGEIEHLPVADESVDVITSNCVVNLSPDKPQVFREAYRVLRPGGRLTISDVVSTAALPPDVRTDPESITGCIAGASPIPELETMLRDVGFVDVSIDPNAKSQAFIREWADAYDPSEFVVAATIDGQKPTT
ncbi:arsenite methyltransferase [Natrialbaceae archaeon AArc-T1-2]|uniref:arsenite methyltransferase n=1 Tax=Natrialbaceae archaeon AArc-T1-2 TaxID=3053904 RepID=UPI00255A89C1|nr:arsenite methyltransferase [Natrialbaceae archaeon AArc-T1-2]WIV66236.1 arsenite methyltransferase [Natrialbaceae archaeon AArc-T1-2]